MKSLFMAELMNYLKFINLSKKWIAKSGIGFAGVLKSEWLEWELSNRVKVIICGSSKKILSTEISKKFN